jgi:hypothetical protein
VSSDVSARSAAGGAPRDAIRRLSWQQYLAVWSAFYVILVLYWLSPLGGEDNGFRSVTVGIGLYIYTSALFCLCAFAVAWYLPITRATFVRAVVGYAVFMYLTTIAHEWFAVTMYRVLLMRSGVSAALAAGPRQSSFLILANMLIAGNAIGLAARAHAREHTMERMQRELAQVQMARLESMVAPTEVFGALEEIRAQLQEDPHQALVAIARLAERLRARILAE